MIPIYQADSSGKSGELVQVSSGEELKKLQSATTDRPILLVFLADWHEPCL